MSFKKILLLSVAACVILFAGCKPQVSSGDDETGGNDTNPVLSTTTTVKNLNFIFNTDSVGFTTITIRRSEWNKMLAYYDYFYKNENSVIAESYEYKKDGKTWKLDTVGIRLRGNTSRYRPQGKDTPTDKTGHTMPNASWSKDYYNYAATCDDNDYRQSHFKIDFEPNDEDRKMADCMKGVALKRSDSVFSSEIFCYYLFHQYGIWTAPRASQTHVDFKFIEDLDAEGNKIEDISECTVTPVDYGVYEMFEEVNKQSLKGRMAKKGNNHAATAWANNDGDLWKCSGGDLSSGSNIDSNFGVEQVEILNADKDESEWDFIWHNPCYDLKTNKKSVDTAKVKFQNFITELNNLSDISADTTAGINARKAFYEKWFYVDFFIKSYAVNMLVGMDDDYWGNANNYYLYFDNAKDGTGKCFFIPFDYDNTLGKSISGDKVIDNPFEWGKGKNRPLLDRLLEVPEYETKLKKALLEVSSQKSTSPWNKENAFAVWEKWHNQVRPYVYSSDIAGHGQGEVNINDYGGWKDIKHYLTQKDFNIYEQVTLNFKNWLTDSNSSITFDLNGGSYNGSKNHVTKAVNVAKPDFASLMGTPERTGYAFVGWTKTKNGSDYLESYLGDSDLTLYASWIDISSASGLTIYEIEDSTYEGIKIYIANLPENHYRRTFYINGKEVGGDSCENPSKYRNVWAYPFTEVGKTYKIQVKYQNKGYNDLETSNLLPVTAKYGIGEFKVTNTPEPYVENNILRWKTEPVIQMGNLKMREDSNWDEYYLIEINTTKEKNPDDPDNPKTPWMYISWNWMGASCNNGFNFKDHPGKDYKDKYLDGTYYDIGFKLSYIYNGSPYGELKLIIYDWGKTGYFNLQ